MDVARALDVAGGCGPALVATPLRQLAIIAIIAIAMIGGCGTSATSGPPASPTISCVGVPQAKCDEAVASVARSLPNSAPVSIEVICVAGVCTLESGAMDTVVQLADGGQLRSTTISWADPGAQAPGDDAPGGVKPPPLPPPPPVVPVEPQCQGVPVSMCRTMAETAFGELSNRAVVQILVRCTTLPCTDAHGVGETVVTYEDRTTQTSGWEYAGS